MIHQKKSSSVELLEDVTEKDIDETPVTEIDDLVSLKFRRDDKDIIKIKVSKSEKFEKIFTGYCTKNY